jgi:hypothetical protein
MLVQNHFAEPNCNGLNFCWFDIKFAGSHTKCGASTTQAQEIKCGVVFDAL